MRLFKPQMSKYGMNCIYGSCLLSKDGYVVPKYHPGGANRRRFLRILLRKQLYVHTITVSVPAVASYVRSSASNRSAAPLLRTTFVIVVKRTGVCSTQHKASYSLPCISW